MARAGDLTPFQRRRALDALAVPDPDRASHGVIEERITDERRCPRRNMPGAARHGMAGGLQRYRCNHCRAVTGDVTDQTVLVGCRDQLLAQAARRRVLGNAE